MSLTSFEPSTNSTEIPWYECDPEWECADCLVSRDMTPPDEPWCRDRDGRALCGQCGRDERILGDPGVPPPRREHLSGQTDGRARHA